MFDQLFVRPTVVMRHCTSPLVEERKTYLAHLTGQGSPRSSVRQTAAYLLVITDLLHLGELPPKKISVTEIELAAKLWATRSETRKNHKPGLCSEERFIFVATSWLEFMGCFECVSDRASGFEPWLKQFDDYMLNERGLSATTRRGRLWVINRFLNTLPTSDVLPINLKIADVDAFLQALGEKDGYSRVSLQMVAGCLRPFVRYGATQGWCDTGLAEAIKSPRVYSLNSLPSGPSWKDVQRLIALTKGDQRTDIRDRPILMLLAIYGLRAGEVRRLRLEDFDWKGELLSVVSSKSGKKRVFPLVRSVGDAVLRYIKEVRPRTIHREVFLTLSAPIRPLGDVWQIVSKRLRPLDLAIAHYGPHALRHACATHLLAEGQSLKQIGDHLGHCDPDATRIYAKVDIVGLRQVADIDLGGLL